LKDGHDVRGNIVRFLPVQRFIGVQEAELFPEVRGGDYASPTAGVSVPETMKRWEMNWTNAIPLAQKVLGIRKGYIVVSNNTRVISEQNDSPIHDKCQPFFQT
jgi:hypothetical protein